MRLFFLSFPPEISGGRRMQTRFWDRGDNLKGEEGKGGW